LGYGPNTRARLITTGLNEFKTLAKGMRFADYEVMTPGVVGDLVLTCSSEQSRNFQYGAQLARSGGRVEPEHTVEGYHTSRSINALAKEVGVKLPLAALTSRIINREVRDAAAFAKFLTD
jgi:glycerol-3-phosphate dehydrogenase (NAD(P)+)